jgi:hypothetical protein
MHPSSRLQKVYSGCVGEAFVGACVSSLRLALDGGPQSLAALTYFYIHLHLATHLVKERKSENNVSSFFDSGPNGDTCGGTFFGHGRRLSRPFISTRHLAAPIWISITRDDPIGVPMPHHLQLLYVHILRRPDRQGSEIFQFPEFNFWEDSYSCEHCSRNTLFATACLRATFLCITNVVCVPSPRCNPTPLPKLATPAPWHS